MPAPVNPVTIKFNQLVLNTYLSGFMGKYLPNYTFRQTSGYRTFEQNKAAGGKADSAHLYGLAADGNLVDNSTGEILSESEGRKLYDTVIKPNWEVGGYTQFYPATSSKRWHMHLNVSRDVSSQVKWAGMAALFAVAAFITNKYIIQAK